MKKIYTHFFLAAAMSALTTIAAAQSKPDPNFQIYICFGQSNMDGAGIIEGQDTLYVDPRLMSMEAVDNPKYNWQIGKWRTAYPPQSRPDWGLSIADYFGRKMVESQPRNIRVGLITVAVSGASIDLFDTDSCASYINNKKKTPQWKLNITKQYDNNPYSRIITLARKAQKEGVIRGILLHQGESDNGQSSWPQRVKKVYMRMLHDLDLKAEDVPLLVGETAGKEEGGCCWLQNSIIDTIARVIPTAHVISSKGCMQRGDSLHFTSEAYRTYGRRYADEMLRLLGVKEKATDWTGTWATAIEPVGKSDMPKCGTLSDKAVRQIIRVSRGGQKLRLRLANTFSKQPLQIKSIFIADALDSSSISSKTACTLTFRGKKQFYIPAEETVVLDPVKYNLRPLQRLAITISYGSTPDATTGHRGSRTTSFIVNGIANKNTSFNKAEKCERWFNIDAIDVEDKLAENNLEHASVAILGNSITDGRGSVTDHNTRWTDYLAQTLQESNDGKNIGILNLGIGGNCIIRGGLGPTALSRFTPDILRQSGVKSVIIYEGVNDIGTSKDGYTEHTAAELIEALKSMAGEAHAHGLKVYAATITPFGKSFYDKGFFREAERQTVNEWIRTAKCFDGVIDFDSIVSDPSDKHSLKSDFQSDWLHLNPVGYKAMGVFAAKKLQEFYFAK